MIDLINIQMKKDNKYSETFVNKKTLEQILSRKKNIIQDIENSENNNSINNLNVNNNNKTEENKTIIKHKNFNVEIIYIIFYGLLGFIILEHIFHFIFSKNVSK